MTYFTMFCIIGIMFLGATLAATMEAPMNGMTGKPEDMMPKEPMGAATQAPMAMTNGPMMMMTTKKGAASTLVVSWTLSIVCLLGTVFHGRRLLSS